MDQQPPVTPGTPPVTPAPAAPPTPTPAPLPPAQTPSPTTPQAPKTPNKNILIAIIVSAITFILVVGGLIYAAQQKDTNGQKSNNTETSETKKEDDIRSANAKTAGTLGDYAILCSNGSIKNAVEPSTPPTIAVFSDNSARKTFSSYTLNYDSEFRIDMKEYEKVDTVACLTRDDETAVQSQVCEFKSGGEMKEIDLYAVKYNLSVYEAKSGKLLKDLGDVSGPALSCPMFVSYDKKNPKIYASADQDEVDLKLNEYVTKL